MFDYGIALAYTFLGVVVGLYVGKLLTDWRWSSNADEPFRIYHRRRLYKVRYDDEPRDAGT